MPAKVLYFFEKAEKLYLYLSLIHFFRLKPLFSSIFFLTLFTEYGFSFRVYISRFCMFIYDFY